MHGPQTVEDSFLYTDILGQGKDYLFPCKIKFAVKMNNNNSKTVSNLKLILTEVIIHIVECVRCMLKMLLFLGAVHFANVE